MCWQHTGGNHTYRQNYTSQAKTFDCIRPCVCSSLDKLQVFLKSEKFHEKLGNSARDIHSLKYRVINNYHTFLFLIFFQKGTRGLTYTEQPTKSKANKKIFVLVKKDHSSSIHGWKDWNWQRVCSADCTQRFHTRKLCREVLFLPNELQDWDLF